jgi:hypothetical protein
MESEGKDNANEDTSTFVSAQSSLPSARTKESKDGGIMPQETQTWANGDVEALSSVTEGASQKLQKISSKAFHKSKDLLSAKSTSSESHSSTNSVLPSTSEAKAFPALTADYLKTDPAFNPAEVINTTAPVATGTRSGRKGGVKGTTKEIVGTVLHPRRAVIHHYRSKTAKSLSKANRPYISPESDREFLAAHDALKAETTDRNISRENRPPGDRPSSDEEMAASSAGPVSAAEIQRRKVEKLGMHRESVAVAWLTGRHIKRVRLVPSNVVDYPRFDDERFLQRNDADVVVRFMWEKYIGQVSRKYPTSSETGFSNQLTACSLSTSSTSPRALQLDTWTRV